MDTDEPRDVLEAESLSLPLAVLGDLPARARFHSSQEAVVRTIESLLRQRDPWRAP